MQTTLDWCVVLIKSRVEDPQHHSLFTRYMGIEVTSHVCSVMHVTERFVLCRDAPEAHVECSAEGDSLLGYSAV
jgi:hypothetical protein